MSGTVRFGVRHKLFFLIMAMLAVNLVVLLFAGSALFEGFYTAGKQAEIKSGAGRLRESYREGDDGFYTVVSELENKNILVAVFDYYAATGGFSYSYHTRQRGSEPFEHRWEPSSMRPPKQELRLPVDAQVLEQLADTEQRYLVTNGQRGLQFIGVVTHLQGNTYLLVETPKGYMREIANLAVQYTAYISAAVLLLGAVFSYFLVARTTRPLQQIQATADKIANLDFSGSCQEGARDEIGLLARSINHMSDELQSNIVQLRNANAILQDDILKQEQTDRMRRQFFANVSHDFKTPLTLITSYAEALRDYGQQDEQVREEYCKIILDEGQKMTRMITQLLGLSQLESGIVKLHKTMFAVSEIVQSVLAKCSILTRPRGIAVACDFSEDIIVLADYQRIEEVITNLFENAVKYTEDGGSIKVTIGREGQSCRVSVYNTGSQIAQKDMENIFLSYYRGEKARRRDKQSYGLGLAIVKSIMELHEKECGVQNLPGGVEFWLLLDIASLDSLKE